jgi:hypothetical protein
VLACGHGAEVFLADGLDRGNLGKFMKYSGTWDGDFEGMFILGGHPLRHEEKDHGFTEKLRACSGGIFLAFWDFLGVNLYESIRRRWAKLYLKTILQLPNPRRQAVTYHPALIELGDTRQTGTRIVRMAAVTKSGNGPGTLPQQETLKLLLDPADGVNSLDVAPQALYADGLLDFSPRRLLTAAKGASVALENLASVIRCQFPRVKVAAGHEKTDKDVFKEITLANLDGICGFVEADTAALVMFPEKSPYGSVRDRQYLLQEGDIVMCFKGKETTLGKVGFVDSLDADDVPPVCGQSLCIIRPHSVNAALLYHYLRREDVRLRIQGRSTGSTNTMLTVNLGDLRKLPIEKPDENDAEPYEEHHKRIRAKMNEIRELYRRVRDEMSEIEQV